MRRSDFAQLCSPAKSAMFAAAALICAYAFEWGKGRQPVLPLEQLGVATSLVSGGGFANPFWRPSGPTAWVTPAVPFLYAAAILGGKWTGLRPFVLTVGFNLIAAASAVYLVMRYCIPKWTAPARIAFVAAYLGYCLLDGNALTNPSALISAESALLLAGLAVTWRNPGNIGGLGMVFTGEALLALTHPGLALAGVTAAGVLSLLARRSTTGRSAGPGKSAALAAAAAVIAGAGPWALRNRSVFHEWIPAKSNGYFELVLAHDQTTDGILTESSILSGNPSTNLRLLAQYQRLGEKDFLDGYHRRAREILAHELGKYLLYSRNRLFNALCFSKATGDTDLVLAALDPEMEGRLVGQGLVLYYGVNPTTYFWPRAEVSEPDERASLAAAGVANLDSVMADWERAQRNIDIKIHGAGAVLEGLAWSGIPTALFLAAILIGSGKAPKLILAAGAMYLVALIPNILITHDIRHQCDFEVIFALFLSASIEVLLRRRASRANSTLN